MPSMKSTAIQASLRPFLDRPPAPTLRLSWDEKRRVWASEFDIVNELPLELRRVFERTGYGCLAAEADVGVVHVCHASDADIEGFRDKPVWYQWQLIKMPTAPLIRLDLRIIDNPVNPFGFESFLNSAEEDQADLLAKLANQDRLYLAFYVDDLSYRYAKLLQHDDQQWQNSDELVAEANRYWTLIPPHERDFDVAKAEFMRRNR